MSEKQISLNSTIQNRGLHFLQHLVTDQTPKYKQISQESSRTGMFKVYIGQGDNGLIP